MSKYDDILHLPHHQSEKHPHMSMHDRAAQFSPFAALTGYDAEIAEAGRLTEQRIELSESRKEELNRTLASLREKVRSHPTVRLTYFVPDALKDGGAYVELVGSVKRIDELTRSILMTDGTEVPIEDVAEIEPLTEE